MLRFGAPKLQRQARGRNRDRWRLWLLFGSACLIVFTIRTLREPETAARIDRVFIQHAASHDTQPTIREALDAEPQGADMGSPPEEIATGQTENNRAPHESRFDMSAVRDNTFFRPEESDAWFAVWAWLADSPPGPPGSRSLEEISYAQLIDQPDIYRGEVITIRGTAHREELLDAPANNLGIEQYHRLVLRPKGGRVWPMVVYSRQLPPDFPRGEDIRADVEVTGVFFKNWSYAWEGGLGLAPVVLASTVGWQPPVVVAPVRTQVSVRTVLTVVIAGTAIAAWVGWWAWKGSRRPYTALQSQSIIGEPAANSEADPL